MSAVETAPVQASHGTTGTGVGGKFLTFRLGGEEYGIAIMQVREIIGLMEITRVPRTPSLVRGVINLRGKVIAVIDLRTRFGLEAVEDTQQTCIIVADVAREEGTLQLGLIVDQVSEVRDIDAAQTEAPPDFGAAVDTRFILAMAKLAQRVVMLLDVNTVLASDELGVLENVARNA